MRLRCYLRCASQLSAGWWTGDSFVAVGFGWREENVRFACRFTRVLSMVIAVAVVVAVKISLDVDSPPARLLTVVRQLNYRSRADPAFKGEIRWQIRCSLFSNPGASLSACTSSTSASYLSLCQPFDCHFSPFIHPVFIAAAERKFPRLSVPYFS